MFNYTGLWKEYQVRLVNLKAVRGQKRAILTIDSIVGGSKGVCPLGRRTQVGAKSEKGRQRAEASVGRGKSVPPPRLLHIGVSFRLELRAFVPVGEGGFHA